MQNENIKTNFTALNYCLIEGNTFVKNGNLLNQINPFHLLYTVGYNIDGETWNRFRYKTFHPIDKTLYINEKMIDYTIKNKNTQDLIVSSFSNINDGYPNFCDEYGADEKDFYQYKYLDAVQAYYVNKSCDAYFAFGYNDKTRYKELFKKFTSKMITEYSNDEDFSEKAIIELKKDIQSKYNRIN